MHYRRYSSVSFSFLTAVLSIPLFFSHAGSASIHGRVIDDATARPVPGAIVILGGTGQRRNTDGEGMFYFGQVDSGRYTLSVHHLAYADAERLVYAPSGFSDTILISLHPVLLRTSEIIVRSTRTPSLLMDTPYALEITADDRLVRRPNGTVADILAQVPGVSLVRDGPWESDVSVRGLSRANVVTLIDNTRIETATDIAGVLSLVNTHDLERVETIRSSGSVLHGTGALGGIVHLMTKRPAFSERPQWNGEMALGATSVNRGASQYLAAEYTDEDYCLRVSGGYQRTGNTTTPAGIVPNSQVHDFTVSGSLGIRTTADQSLYVSYQQAQAEDTGIPGGTPFPASAKATYTLARRRLFGMEYAVPNPWPWLPLLTVRASHQTIERRVEVVQNPTVVSTPHAIHATTSIQIESGMAPLPDCLLTLGAEAWQRTLDSRRERSEKTRNTTTGERPIPPSRFFSGGVYAQGEWDILPGKLTLTPGIRFDRIHVSSDETLTPEYVIASGLRQSSPAGQKILWAGSTSADASWSVSTGVRYSITNMVHATFLAATAFRSPSLEERFQFLDLGNIVYLGDPRLASERSHSLNGGIRVQGQTLGVQADVFLNQLRDLVARVPGTYEGRPALLSANVGKARLYGFEVSAGALCTSWLCLNASASYVRGEDLRAHAALPQIPPLTGYLQLAATLQRIGTLETSCTCAATQDLLAPGETRTAGYALFDAGLTSASLDVEGTTMIFRCGVQNLFNRAYRTHLSTLRGGITIAPGRNFYVSVTANL